MKPRELLEVLSVAARLKDTPRHSYTQKGRHESVAEHSWMTTFMALMMRDEFPEADMDKVIKMCIVHDLGEAFTGDIPAFEKTGENEKDEEKLLYNWVGTLPDTYSEELSVLFDEMAERQTLEAKIYKAIDGLEALVQHNAADLSTWLPLEYEFNRTYADDKVAFSDYLTELREEIRKDTIEKIEDRKMKTHFMNLFPSPFEEIRSGRKSIELRLYDEKRQEIEVGDLITFVNTENEAQRISARVVAMHVFDSFKELYENLPLLKCGYTEEDVGTASYKDMSAYYSEEKQKKYKALGIEIELV